MQPNIQIWDLVLDGGYLLRVVDWLKGSTYEDIINTYQSFLKRLGNNVIIVFDGYLTNNTKDQTHQKRYPM